MSASQRSDLIFAIIFGVVGAVLLALFLRQKKKVIALPSSDEEEQRKQKKKLKRIEKIFFISTCVAFWLALSHVLHLFFGQYKEELSVDIFPPQVSVFGLSVSESVAWTWVIIAAVLVLSLLFRFLVVPRFKDKPTGIQNVAEMVVEWFSGYSDATGGVDSDALSAYMLSTTFLLLGSMIVEFFGVRAPTSDLVTTAALAIVAFVMFNYYGIKKKGVLGRIKSFAEPVPIVFPFEILSSFSKPISLACRLFGNMLGGMIVIKLLYVALGSYSVGIPAVAGLYFNLFHPVIQAYIFITLSLTFIREAAE